MGWVEDVRDFLFVLLQSIWAVCTSVFWAIVPQPLKSVKGKVVLITGTGSGLGRLLAVKFAQLDAVIVLVDVQEVKNNETFETIKNMDRKAFAYTCDVSNENQVENLAAKVFREVGKVDIIINNAGILPGKPFLELSNSQIRKTLEVNTLAHFWMIRKFLPHMLERGEGHIVAVASIAGILGSSYLVDYCASKYAVVGMMSALREELYETGKEELINLTVICPSTMNTGLVQKPKTRFPKILPVLDVDQVSDIAVKAVLTNKPLVVIPTVAHVIFKIANLFPVQVPLKLQRFFEYSLDPNVK
ncbi:short-chain dehydrogenase/reductase family 16C member 6-like [Uloborus diversus]|uniref:short-chain dehydrogenase/reductase family 16C member 6-like n=1 Tax=Uloborus diversus TaxID=327109 RepID=UPI00240995FC|nr:short-chain dehydrogenase/reductase family 16C member 6-like [Uloborus diversus]